MVKLVCYNSAGETIEKVYQWDANRQIRLRGVTIEEGTSYQVHFGNRKNKDSFVLVPTIESPDFVTEIPMELLEHPDVILVYVYKINTTTNERQTIGETMIPVVPRAIPQDYVSESTDGIIKVADGFIYQDGTLYLASNGVIVGTGLDITFSDSGSGISELEFIGGDLSEIGIAETEE